MQVCPNKTAADPRRLGALAGVVVRRSNCDSNDLRETIQMEVFAR